MTTGRKLLQGNSRVETMYAIIHEPAPQSSTFDRAGGRWQRRAQLRFCLPRACGGRRLSPKLRTCLAIVSVLSRRRRAPSLFRMVARRQVHRLCGGAQRRMFPLRLDALAGAGDSPPASAQRRLWLSLILSRASRLPVSFGAAETAGVMSAWSWINRPRRRSTEVVTRKMTRGCGRHAIKTAQ